MQCLLTIQQTNTTVFYRPLDCSSSSVLLMRRLTCSTHPKYIWCVRFQLISKLFGQTLRCVFSVVVVILEVEIKAAWQVGLEGWIDGLFQDVQRDTDLGWIIYSGPGGRWLVPWLSNPLLVEPKGWGEYYTKRGYMNNTWTDALSALIRYLALAMSRRTRLVQPCWDITMAECWG